ncbi:RDD family protein [Flavobacterium sp. DGU11]|uniref:RDD family protein n=1 Tax=Flavobacterium arundinis TaxID=3139143 RepID=A0ABU9HXC9_9FLAO
MHSDTIDVTDDMLASKGKRFGTFMLDTAVFYILQIAVALIAGILYTVFEYDGMLLWVTEMSDAGMLVLVLSINMFYFIVMEGVLQRTLGKMVTGTKVVMEDGSKPPAGVIVLRTVCRLIPFEAFSFLGERGRGWHDSITHTYVVDTAKYNHALNLKNSFSEIGEQLKY